VTAAPILAQLAKESGIEAAAVQRVLEMVEAGLGATYVARFRRAEVGDVPEHVVRRLEQRRAELEELDRRRATIQRLVEASPTATPEALAGIQSCMDRFELEDLYLPHRRPEPEVQLALDRGLGRLADALVAPLPRPARAAKGAAEAEGAAVPSEAGGEPDEAPAADAEESAAETAEAVDHDALARALEDQPDAHAAEDGAPAAEHGEHAAPHPDDPTAAQRSSAAAEPAAPAKLDISLVLARLCAEFVNPDRGVHTDQEALNGAMRILSDRLGRDPAVRGMLRRTLRKEGVLSVRALVPDARLGRHRPLLRIRQPLRQLQGHVLIALRQAQKERHVTTTISLARERALPKVRAALGRRTNPEFEGVLLAVAEQAYERRLLPMVEADVRLELKERGDEDALRYLTQHLRQVLLLSPAGARNLAGCDVNAKGDWTIAAVDERGAALAAELKVETSGKEPAALGAELAPFLAETGARGIAVPHGKQGRAAAPKLRAALAAAGLEVHVFLVDEGALSAYAHSELARRELPERSVPARIAVSLARRLQDPLVELLKVDPRNWSLGPEQGLATRAALARAYAEAVESCLAIVGCDLNGAPVHVLARVPGLDETTAAKIAARRAEVPFASREELHQSGILTEAQWTTAAACLRVESSNSLFDRTGFHPEQEPLLQRMASAAGASLDEFLAEPGGLRALAREDFGVDEATWRDVARELARRGRDARLPLFPARVLAPGTDPKSLQAGQVVEGIVSKVASFGAFVDIGLVKDALVHISEISERYLRDAREVLAVGLTVRARVQSAEGGRVTLSLKNVPYAARRAPHGEDGGGAQDARGEARQRRGRRDGGTVGDGAQRERARSAPELVVRAASTRRDGGGGASGRRRERGKDGPGGERGDRGRRDGRGSRERYEPGERFDTRALERKPSYTPFATFFKAAKASGTDEAGAEPS
jgi:uncharacterized protein